MPKPALVIFDCDGVLIDSEFIATKVELEMLKEHGYESDASEHARKFIGLNFAQSLKIIEQESGRYFPEDIVENLEKELDSRLWRDVVALPGAHDVLDLLELPRCICSNSSSERLKMTLTKTELWDRFRPYVFSAISLPDINAKPAPDIFLHAARELETDPEACVVIEDSAHGVAGARAAGMRVIGYVGATHSYDDHGDHLMDAGAETIIKNLKDLAPVVEAFAEWEGF